MASPSVHIMPEHWTELSMAKKQRQLCSDDLRQLLASCRKECGKKQVTDCPKCYVLALDRMRFRYAESQDREWFTQRKAFLHELEGMFQDAKDNKRSLESIEARIDSEKEAWYRWVLRKYPEFIAVSDRGSNQDELRGMLDDPDRSREELVGMMLEGVGTPPSWPSSVDAFAEKVAAIGDDASALRELYVTEFFMNQSSGQVLENALKYLSEFRSNEAMTIEDVIDRIASDMKESRNSVPLRNNHQRRLDELRRAKTAFEHDKMQAKIRASGAQMSKAMQLLYDLPPCYVCQGTVDPANVLSCSLCQTVLQMGAADSKLTVYCTEDCFHKGHAKHVEAEHDCKAGDACVQLRDEDVEMDDGSWTTVSCKECLDEKQMTLYCSDRCARENIAEHRRAAHGAKASAVEADGLVSPTQDVVETALKTENPGLTVSRVEYAVSRSHDCDPSYSEPPGPSSTFSIDFAIPQSSEPEDGLEFLRETHAQSIDHLFPDECEEFVSEQHVSPGTAGLLTPSSSSTQSNPLSHSIHDLSGKPLFNLASAESLLRSFRCDKLKSLPCIVLPPDAAVPHLAATQPFVLLAILAASSGSRKLQGHGLYDQEFRKVLSLKFVAGGERTLELLQGILIYTAWYPFHLRPKEKQGFQYMKMASELIHDLDLARELPPDFDISAMEPTERQLDGIRAYLCYFYITTTHTVSWKYKSVLTNNFNASTSTYCDILERNARDGGDVMVSALGRNSCALNEAYIAIHEDNGHSETNRRLLLSRLGMRIQENLIMATPEIASSVTFRLQSLFLQIYNDCGSLLRYPRAPKHLQDSILPLDSSSLTSGIDNLGTLLDELASLDEAKYLCFTLDDWVRFIVTVILSLRLSFPITECPQHDPSWARSRLKFDQFLSRMSLEPEVTPTSKRLDVLSASRVVLGVVREKYRHRLQAVEKLESLAAQRVGCPVVDGSVDSFLSLWEAGFVPTQTDFAVPSTWDGLSGASPSNMHVYNDLWATMTMNWAGGDLSLG
ncbi:hypothetical protein HIM_04899 [Hirsutella minnesotensis 3608]|uniref:MYND-type zinc finger protein samB n=1 Tax=Hirsutella minnesotensis 3608 TaxID=1043627 RepID=A0A0F8A101_9HYPO|nr:hypothetical protein HIM_04899 [Hirsutella minnesotensis 3608]